MLDDRNLQDHPPFDASALETELSSLIPRRTTPLPRPSLRRNPADPYSPPIEPAAANGAEMEESSGAKDSTAALLDERQTTHGSFEDNAKISQAIKGLFRDHLGWAGLTDVEREAMDMIALKFSRILSGRSMECQHWEDIAGYARLVEDLCK